MNHKDIDALIAEKVFGRVWDEKRCRICGWPLDDGTGIDLRCLPSNCSMRPAPLRRADQYEPYSTDIAAAWLVVEKFDDFNLDLIHHGNGWTFKIYKDATLYESDAENAPMAICLAALKSVGVEIEQVAA
ncbi:MAG TPA: hypothetical protein VEF04_04835 [Blastocatellia bacterium]|nr:hypothetical protein [Blastocatellia bacterium]